MQFSYDTNVIQERPRTFRQTYKRLIQNKGDKLGSGAQGTVFKVVRRDDPQGKVYAAKTFTNSSQKTAASVFKKELRGYGIIQQEKQNGHLFGKVVDSFDQYLDQVLILDLIEGKPLNRHLWSVKRQYYKKKEYFMIDPENKLEKKCIEEWTKHFVTKKRIVKWMLQMAQVVQTLQSHGIFYGDLHFDNLMVTDRGDNLRLTDFGYHFVYDKQTGKFKYNEMPDKFEYEHGSPEQHLNRIQMMHNKQLAKNLDELLDHFNEKGVEIDDLKELSKSMKYDSDPDNLEKYLNQLGIKQKEEDKNQKVGLDLPEARSIESIIEELERIQMKHMKIQEEESSKKLLKMSNQNFFSYCDELLDSMNGDNQSTEAEQPEEDSDISEFKKDQKKKVNFGSQSPRFCSMTIDQQMQIVDKIMKM